MKRYLLIIFVFFGLLLIGAQVAFCQPERGKAAPQELLPDELRDVEVKDYHIGSDAGAVGTIQAVAGHVVVARFEESEAYFAAPGDAVFKGDVLYTLKSSRCRVLFFGQDLITLADDTRIVIEEVIDDREAGEKKSAFSMLRGKVMCYVMRLFRYKHISFSISTPTAVTGVRGTKFGVEVGTEETVAELPNSEEIISGGIETTTVHCFEGKVEVYSPVDGTTQGVEGGESLELSTLGAGIVEPTTPEAAERFILDTEALPVPGEDSQSGDGAAVTDEEFGNDTGALSSVFQDDVIDTVQTQVTKVIEDANSRPTSYYDYVALNSGLQDDVIDTIQTQGTEAIEDANSRPTSYYDYFASDTGLQDDVIDTVQTQVTRVIEDANSRPARHYGYFGGMLTKVSTGPEFYGTYRSQDICNFDSNNISASYYNSVKGIWYLMLADGSADYDDPKITYLGTSDGDITSGLPVSLRHTELGYNACMEWGYWTQPLVMSDGTNDFRFDNRGYYVLGDNTTDSQMSVLAANNITGTYSGDAYGTYWTSEGGANMSGNFSTSVNFTTRKLSDFNLSVSGDGISASISGATGTFTDPTSQFVIDGGTGAWQIDGTDAATKAAEGSVYGANGEAIGGLWEMGDGTNYAVGMFQGTK